MQNRAQVSSPTGFASPGRHAGFVTGQSSKVTTTKVEEAIVISSTTKQQFASFSSEAKPAQAVFGRKKTPTLGLGGLLLGASKKQSTTLSGRGKSVIGSLVKGLVEANDVGDLINFNISKQKMILSKIKEKMGDIDISDEQLLKDVQEAVATKAEREAEREEKRQAHLAELEKRDLEALKKKLADIKLKINAKVASIKEIKVSFQSIKALQKAVCSQIEYFLTNLD